MSQALLQAEADEFGRYPLADQQLLIETIAGWDETSFPLAPYAKKLLVALEETVQ